MIRKVRAKRPTHWCFREVVFLGQIFVQQTSIISHAKWIQRAINSLIAVKCHQMPKMIDCLFDPCTQFELQQFDIDIDDMVSIWNPIGFTFWWWKCAMMQRLPMQPIRMAAHSHNVQVIIFNLIDINGRFYCDAFVAIFRWVQTFLSN